MHGGGQQVFSYNRRTFHSAARANFFLLKSKAEKCSNEPIPEVIAYNVLKSHGFSCACCGKSDRKKPLSVRYIVPPEFGGRMEEENLAPTCNPCNSLVRQLIGKALSKTHRPGRLLFHQILDAVKRAHGGKRGKPECQEDGEFSGSEFIVEAVHPAAKQRKVELTVDGSNLPLMHYLLNKLLSLGYSEHSGKISSKTRQEVYLKFGNRCFVCRETQGPGSPLMQIHHVRPRSFGGESVLENLRPLCADCHTDLHNLIERLLLAGSASDEMFWGALELLRGIQRQRFLQMLEQFKLPSEGAILANSGKREIILLERAVFVATVAESGFLLKEKKAA